MGPSFFTKAKAFDKVSIQTENAARDEITNKNKSTIQRV